MKSRWKIYFAVTLFQTIGFPLSIFYEGSPLGVSEFINWIFIIIGAVGLSCYVFQISVKKTKFWIYFLVAFVLWDLFYLLYWQPMQFSAEYPPMAWFYAIALLLLLIPHYMALYRLSRPSPVANVKTDSET